MQMAFVFRKIEPRPAALNQIIPVPRDSSDKIKEALAKAEEGLELVAFDPARHSSRGSFFRIELPNGEHLIYYPRARMSLQMGRYFSSLGYSSDACAA